MKLKIEDWLNNQNVSVEAKSLLTEAIICYKASAYKAGLLFSYLFFQTVLKERLITARRPESIPESLWRGTQQKLSNDDTWDDEVYESVKRSQPNVFFVVTDDLRHQVTYWKNRRNDCAHAKRNTIDSSHIESFWLFLQSNLSKFVVNGGKAALIEKIKVHFDRRLTPSTADPNRIIQEIPHALFEHEYADFFRELNATFEETSPMNDEFTQFWLSLFSLPVNHVPKLLDYLIEDNKILFESLLFEEPGLVIHLNGRDQVIRQLWYESNNSIKIYIALLRNNLIPEDQRTEAMEMQIRSHKSIVPDMLTHDELEILVQCGFHAHFREIAFVERMISQFDWANHRKRYMVIWYIKRFGFDEEVTSALFWTFNGGPSPWHLRDALRALFTEDERIRNQFIEWCEVIGEDPPASLGF